MSILRKVRTQHWFGPVRRELAAWGVGDWEIRAPTGKGHPKLIARVDGREIRMPVPCSGGGHVPADYLIAQLRRKLRPVLTEGTR